MRRPFAAPWKPLGPSSRARGANRSQRPPAGAVGPPSREKMFGVGRPRALDRNAKFRIMHWARCLSRRTEKGRGIRRDHRQGAGGPRGAALGLPQCPERALLPELRGDRRGRPLRPLDRGGGYQGAGGSGDPDLGAADQAGALALQRLPGRQRMALAGAPDVKRVRVPRSQPG
jgi:hypothetical protein